MYDIGNTEIVVDDWLLVQYHTSFFICKVTKVGVIEFEGEFIRKKPSQKKDTTSMLFVHPPVPDVCEFMYDQIIGKIDPPSVLRRGIYQFSVMF